MKIKQQELIQDLIERTKQVLSSAEEFNTFSIEQLNYRTDPHRWSILECLEHLNFYGDYYIPEIEQQIAKSKSVEVLMFKSGLLGNYFAKSMLPKEKLNTMKTFKDKDPLGSSLDKTTIRHFINQQQKMLDLLNTSSQIDLNKAKIAISISKWIKLKLGDTFRFVIFHNQRHLVQAFKVLKEYQSKIQNDN